MPDPVIRTIAPNTICANASTSATSESLLSEDISRSMMHGAPCRREEKSKNDCGEHSPQHFSPSSGVWRRVDFSRAWHECRAQQRKLGYDAHRGSNPVDHFRKWVPSMCKHAGKLLAP
jgi:hypothetical protein